MKEKVMVLGASENSSRYSYKAILKLNEYGHQVFAIGKKAGEVRGVSVKTIFPTHKIDTISIYLNLSNQKEYYERILDLEPNRIIFNPGAENEELFNLAKSQNIDVINACTLVMLSLGVF
ncbi:MAG: CoA-binding protein [Crocinitomicaceae bacterium]|nr:CoA-binding protein [Crocinitomicaceae bacterium]|tara:strand:+ start:1796 stop:2155 length:360 start_codon:yes stop_codon:yes gene_type:complete